MGETMIKVGALVLVAFSIAAMVIMVREGFFSPLPGILGYLKNSLLVRLGDALI